MNSYYTDEHIPGPYEQVSSGWWPVRCSCGQTSPREKNPIGAAQDWMDRHRETLRVSGSCTAASTAQTACNHYLSGRTSRIGRLPAFCPAVASWS